MELRRFMDSEIVSQVLSLAALIVSILAAIYSERTGRASIRADNCGKIFDIYLIDKIPKSRTNLRFGADGKLHNGNEFSDILTEMLMSALFYKYSDNLFYENLGKKCQWIEDLIAEAGNHPIPSEHEQSKFWNELQNELEGVYKMVEDKRIGRAKAVQKALSYVHK